MLKLKDVKRWWYIVLGAVIVGGCAYIYLHRHELGLAASSAEEAVQPRPARIAWTSIDRSSEGFKVEMPTDTREVAVPAYSEQGGADEVSMIYSYPDSGTSFSVAWEDNPPVERSAGENAGQTLDSARDGALARTQTQMVTESSSSRQGYLTRDFAARNDGGGVFNARFILAGRRLYMLMAAFPAASARRDSDVYHFFDSFRVVASRPPS